MIFTLNNELLQDEESIGAGHLGVNKKFSAGYGPGSI